MAGYQRPGVYFEWTRREQTGWFQTGRPVFVGFVEPEKEPDAQDCPRPWRYLSHWSPDQFARVVGRAIPGGFLISAVRGFFENGGDGCFVVPLPLRKQRKPEVLLLESFADGGILDDVEDADLVCVPDLMQETVGPNVVEIQQVVLRHCQRMGDRFAILDAVPPKSTEGEPAGPTVQEITQQRQMLNSDFGALYHPWLRVSQRADSPRRSAVATRSPRGPAALTTVPPCGHVAGVYARTDREMGPHKAPANAVVEGALELASSVADRDQGILHEAGVNCLCYLDGRGLRVWGARTLSLRPAWRYINVRRVVLTLTRWLELNLTDFVFEPNEPSLWERIRTRLAGYCQTLYRQGALQGRDRGEAFFIKCDAESNPREEREAGRVVAYLGLAALAPAEFVILRITQSVSEGIRIAESPFEST